MVRRTQRFILPQSFGERDRALILSLNTSEKIQNFLDALPSNFEPEGDTVLSPLRVIRERRAHCIEAAMFAALCLRAQGSRPLILDLTANNKDQDHVICLFKRGACWGAIAKSNHHCLGYRDAVYRTTRELVMSFFHEYLNNDGEKTLRSFSKPIDLSRFDHKDSSRCWMTMERSVWQVPSYIIKQPHSRIMTRTQEKYLRRADDFTRDVNNLAREEKPDT